MNTSNDNNEPCLKKFKKCLGSTGIEVSPIGLGTVKLGRNEGVKYPKSFSIPSEKDAKTLLATAKNLGINLLDTAPAYGNSEERLGHLLKGQRQDWIICGKTGEEFQNGESYFDFSPEHTRKSVMRSLERLKTDYIDIVLVHSDGNDEDIIENQGTLETLAELKQQGLIRAFGMSTKTLSGGLLAAEKSDIVMVTCNLNQQKELPVIEAAYKNNKGVLIKKALASGHITQGDIIDPIQASMNFIFSQKGVGSIIVGTINPVHLKHNAEAAAKSLLSNN